MLAGVGRSISNIRPAWMSARTGDGLILMVADGGRRRMREQIDCVDRQVCVNIYGLHLPVRYCMAEQLAVTRMFALCLSQNPSIMC